MSSLIPVANLQAQVPYSGWQNLTLEEPWSLMPGSSGIAQICRSGVLVAVRLRIVTSQPIPMNNASTRFTEVPADMQAQVYGSLGFVRTSVAGARAEITSFGTWRNLMVTPNMELPAGTQLTGGFVYMTAP